MTLILAERATADGESQRSRGYTDNVIPHLSRWVASGERCALVTLVGVDGNAPRAVGAQMVVSESGNWAGYISGGCLEQAIALEAVEIIKSQRPRVIRYGKGSPYFDIRLPCGSGLDVLIQPFHDKRLVAEMEGHLVARQPFALRIDLADGASAIEPWRRVQPRKHYPTAMEMHFFAFIRPLSVSLLSAAVQSPLPLPSLRLAQDLKPYFMRLT